MIESLINRHLNGFPAKTILEVGPGYGQFGLVAARITGARKIIYVDCDQAVLDFQAGQCAKAGLEGECRNALLSEESIACLPPADVILCQEVLEHLENAEEVLTALAARLSGTGRVVITVPTKWSERWIKRINPGYMRDEPHGHVREFDEAQLRDLVRKAGLGVSAFVPTQPHYLVAHTWLFGTRAPIEGSTGRLRKGGFRTYMFSSLGRWSRRFFSLTGPEWWGRRIPRNYFVLASRANRERNAAGEVAARAGQQSGARI